MRFRAITLLLFALLFLPLQIAAQAEEDAPALTASEWIQSTGIHKVFGYASLGLATTAAATALLAPEVHPPFAYATLGSALVATTLGAIGYWDYRDIVWPHFLFMGLAETGFALNAFVLEPGSSAHKVTGILSYALMAAGYVAIKILF